MTDWHEGYIQENGIKIHYYRSGGDKPALVLSHGATDDGTCFPMLARQLASSYDVILPDARGHGLSDSGAGNYGSDARASDLEDTIQVLKLEQPFIGGHSMGADSSLQLAIRHPELVRGVFLEDPPLVLPGKNIFGGEMGEKLVSHFKDFIRFIRLLKILPVRIGVVMARRMNPTFPEESLVPWVKSKKRLNNDVLNSLDTLLGWDAPYDLLTQLDVPTLIITGDREKGSIVSSEEAREAAEGRDNIQLVHIPGASHDIRRCDFPHFNEALQNFLQSVS